MKITQGKRRELSPQEVARLRRRLAQSRPIPIYTAKAIRQLADFQDRMTASNLPESQRVNLAILQVINLFKDDNLFSPEINRLIRKESPFKFFILALVSEMSGGNKAIKESETLTNLAINLGTDLESSAEPNLRKAFVLSLKDFTHRTHIENVVKVKGIAISLEHNGVISLQQAVQFCDAIDVQCNIVCGRVIYADDEIALTWGCSNQETLALGQLMFATRDPDGLWSYDKDDEVRISSRSLRNAQRACKEWTGKALCGEIIHEESRRLCKFLGLEIKQDFAYLHPYKPIKQGFGQVTKRSSKKAS